MVPNQEYTDTEAAVSAWRNFKNPEITSMAKFLSLEAGANDVFTE